MGALAARRLARGGARVAAVDRDSDGLTKLDAENEDVHAYECDVTDRAAVDVLVKRIESDLGPVDRVVNAAGILRTGSVVDMPTDEFHMVMSVNYGGTVNVVKSTLRGMLERGRGDVVNFASLAGWIPAHGISAYSASKHAVVAFTEVLAHEQRDSGLRICCVCPPTVDTPMLGDIGPENRSLRHQRPVGPEIVIEAVERSLENDDLFCFPGRGTQALHRARRWTPGLIWRSAHRAQDG